MIQSNDRKPLRYRTFTKPAGTVQIVELLHGRCHVGYKPSEDGAQWQHWGQGDGGYDATVARFAECPTFNPGASEPLYSGKDTTAHRTVG